MKPASFPRSPSPGFSGVLPSPPAKPACWICRLLEWSCLCVLLSCPAGKDLSHISLKCFCQDGEMDSLRSTLCDLLKFTMRLTDPACLVTQIKSVNSVSKCTVTQHVQKSVTEKHKAPPVSGHSRIPIKTFPRLTHVLLFPEVIFSVVHLAGVKALCLF